MQRFRFKVVIGPRLTYTRTLEIAQGAEEAEKFLREIRTPRNEHDVVGADTTNKQEPVNRNSS